MTLLRKYIEERKQLLKELIKKHNHNEDEHRYNELEQLEDFIEEWKREFNSL